MADDPYTETIDGLWAILEADSDFADMVREGNRIKHTGTDRDPIKAEVGEGDLPEVRIVPTNSLPHYHRTSSASTHEITLEVQVSTGDQRLDQYHYPLMWIIFKALKDVEATLKADVTWNAAKIIREANPVNIVEGLSNPELNRGIKGWASIWAIRVVLWFQHSSL